MERKRKSNEPKGTERNKQARASNENTSSELMKTGIETIDNYAAAFNEISQEIWLNPEVGSKEKHAHAVLTTFLEKEGFQVAKQTPLETSFVAKYGHEAGVKVGVMCEYDALPGIGHGCGHNLIAEAGIAVGIGLKAILEENAHIKAQVVVFGTPDEEDTGGKVDMINKGCFRDMDVCLMTHPGPVDLVEFEVLATKQVSFVYHGKESHAAACPWVAKNALDAAVQCYNNISMLRQQMKPGCLVHGIIIDGGVKPNIIPNRSEIEYYIRGPTCKDRDELLERVNSCAKAAAQATGCTLEMKPTGNPCSDLKPIESLKSIYKKHAESLGIAFFDPKSTPKSGKDLSAGSTDMGNVSYVAPSIHPIYRIGDAFNHTKEFTAVSGLPEAQKPTLDSAKALLMTAVEVITNGALLSKIKEEFNKKSTNEGTIV